AGRLEDRRREVNCGAGLSPGPPLSGSIRLGKFCQSGYTHDQMPTRNISLTPEQDAFVEKVVATGEYQNASEAVRDALRVLQQRRREDELKVNALRAQLQAGIDALDGGDYVDLDEVEFERYLAPSPDRQQMR